jgi:hypothetical protein
MAFLEIMKNSKIAISNTVFAVATIALVAVAAAGYGLYLGYPQQVTITTTKVTTATVTTTVIPSVSGGFLNSKVVTFIYNTPSSCIPSLNQLFNTHEAANASSKTNCEVGAAGTFASNALPVWVLVPAFAGLSIFGVSQLGASPQGFPTFHNQTIVTDCGAGGSPTACPDHPTLLYSPAFTAVEKHLGIQNGVFGLPEGVLPTPAHDHIVSTDAAGANIPWYVIAVLVFDPNILPNPVTGQCSQVASSSLPDPISNCLTSLAALQRAMNTTNTTEALSNSANPIWQTLGQPDVQVVIPGVTLVSEVNNANSNLVVTFAVQNSNPYPPTP